MCVYLCVLWFSKKDFVPGNSRTGFGSYRGVTVFSSGFEERDRSRRKDGSLDGTTGILEDRVRRTVWESSGEGRRVSTRQRGRWYE